jgi:anti-sigma28 factor (negative regulator of flagellin synthesis)
MSSNCYTSYNGKKSVLADLLLENHGQEIRDRVMSHIYSDEFATKHGDFVTGGALAATFGSDDKVAYTRAVNLWERTRGKFERNNLAEAQLVYERQVREHGKDFVNKPFQLAENRFVVYVKKPKLSDKSTLDLNYAANFDKMWKELTPDEQAHEIELAEETGKLFNEAHEGYNTFDTALRAKYFNEGDETDSVSVLTKIVESNHPLSKVAEKLIPFVALNNVRVSLVQTIETSTLINNPAAVFIPLENRIEIKEGASFRGRGSEPTIIHEILHAISHNQLRSNTETNKSFTKLFEHAKSVLPEAYALLNIDEFFVALYTDAEFIQLLSTLPPLDSVKYSNLLEEIIDSILAALDITKSDPTLYNQAFFVAAEILETFKENAEASKSYQEIIDSIPVDTLGQEPTYEWVKSNLLKAPLKPGVTELFESNPELASIGTQEEYSQYLDTIFPDSQIKDIVYHRSDIQFDNFDNNRLNKETGGVFDFSKTPGNTQYGKYLHSVLLNIKNLKEGFEGGDGYVNEIMSGEKIYSVKDSEQTHILGTQQDIEGFKEFVGKGALALDAGAQSPDSTRVAKLEEVIDSIYTAELPVTYDKYWVKKSREEQLKNFKSINQASLKANQLKIVQDLIEYLTELVEIPTISTPERIKVDPTQFTNHSGGAIGADMMWDTIGREFGFTNHNHYWANAKTPGGNVQLTDAQLAEGVVHAKAAAKVLGRPWNDKFANLLGRNWYQVKNSTQVVAIAPLIQPGEKNSKGYTSKAVRTTVDGGTGYAVEMGIANGKEVVVFDTKTNEWYKWNGTTFEQTGVPTLHKNFAGIGSRQDNGTMTPESVQAIRDIYQNTLQSTAESKPVQTSTAVPGITMLRMPEAPNPISRKNLTNENIKEARELLEREIVAAAVAEPDQLFTVPWENPRVNNWPDSRGIKPSEYAQMLDDLRTKMGDDFPPNLKLPPAFLFEMNNNTERLLMVFTDKINEFKNSRLAWRLDQTEMAKMSAKMEICITDQNGKVEDYFAKKHGKEAQLGLINALTSTFYLMYNQANGNISVPHLFGQLLKESKRMALENTEMGNMWKDVVNSFAFNGTDPKLSFIDSVLENLAVLGYKIDIADRSKLKTYFNLKKTDPTFVKVDEGMTINIEESTDYEKEIQDYISDNLDDVQFNVEDTRTEVVKGWQDSSFEKNSKSSATARLKIFMAGQGEREHFDIIGVNKLADMSILPDAMDISHINPDTLTVAQARQMNNKVVYHSEYTGPELEAALRSKMKRLPAKTQFGIPTLIQFDTMYENVQGLLADIPNLRMEEALAILRSQRDANLEEFADRLEKTSVRNQKEFIKVMRMQYNKFLVLRADSGSDGGKDFLTTRVINAQRYSQNQTIVKAWTDAQMVSPMIKVRETGEKVLDVEQARHHLGVINMMQLFQRVDFRNPNEVLDLTVKLHLYLNDLAISNPAARLFIGNTSPEAQINLVDALIKEETSEARVPRDQQRATQKALLKRMFAAHGIQLSTPVLNDMAGYYYKNGQRVDFITSSMAHKEMSTDWLGQFTNTTNGKSNGIFSAFFNRAAGVTYGAELDESVTEELENLVKENNPIYLEEKTMGVLASFTSRYSEKLFNSVHTTIEGKQNWDYSYPSALSNIVSSFKTNKDGVFTSIQESVWGGTYYMGKLDVNKFNLSYLEGLNMDNALLGRVRPNMSDREQLLVAVNMFTNQGHKLMHMISMAHSDKTTTPVFSNIPRVQAIGKDGNLTPEIVNAVYTLFEGEWLRIKRVQELKRNQGTAGSEAMDDGGERFILFPTLNKESLGKNSMFLFDEQGNVASSLDAGVQSFVKERIAEYLTQIGDEAVQYFKDNGIDHTLIDTKYQKKNYKDLKGKTKNEEILRRTAYEYALNSVLWNASSVVMFMGDPANAWKGNEEKTLAFYSKRLAKDIAPGQQLEFENPLYSHLTITDVTMTYGYAAKFGSNVQSSEATDAQELTTVREHLNVMYKAGKIEEKLYNELIEVLDKDGDFSDEQLQQMIEPMGAMKPVYAGARYENGLIFYDYLKTMSFPLFKEYTKDTELDKLRLLMEGKLPGHETTDGKELYQRCSFKSGSKLGNNPKLVKLFDEDNKFVSPDKDALVRSTRQLDRANFRIQQEVPYDESKTKIGVVTQMDKLIVEGILEMSNFTIDDSGKTYSGQEVRQRKEAIRIAMATRNLKDLYSKLGIKNATEQIEPKKVIELLVDAARAGEFPPNDIALLEGILSETETKIDSKGNPVEVQKDYMAYPLFFHSAVERFEKLLLAQVKKVTEFKMPGKSYVQASSIGMRRLASLSAADRKGIVTIGDYNLDEPLRHMSKDENGNVLPAQVIAPFNFHINGVKQKVSDYLIEGTNQLDMARVPKELLQLVGARIPNQGHNSMIPIEIVGFTPEWMGDLMIVPGAITGQMGSDFDVDKLYTYQRPYWHNPETNSFMEVTSGEKETTDTLQKDYFNIHWGILTHKDMYAKVFSKLDKTDLAKANKKFARGVTGAHTYFSAITQLKTFQSAKDAKSLVGATSLASTQEANLQKFATQGREIKLGNYYTDKEGMVHENPRPLELNGLRLSHLAGEAISRGEDSTDDMSTWYSKHDNITIDQSGAVDNANNRDLDNLNITLATYPAFVAMNMIHQVKEKEPNLGLSKNFQTALSVQEILNDYTREYRKGNDSLSEEYNANLQATIIEGLARDYTAKWKAASALEKKEKNSDEDLVKEIATTNVDERMLVAAFNTSLKEEAKDSLYYTRQLAVLKKFERLLEIGERIRQLQKTLNQDTNGAGPNLVYLLQQEENHEKLGHTTMGKIFIGEHYLTEPEHQLEQMYQMTIPIAKNLLASVFPVDAISSLMSQVAMQQGKVMSELPLKVQLEVLRNFRSFLISTSPAIAMNSTAERLRLLYNTETNKSLAVRVAEYMKENKTNSLINRISTDIAIVGKGPDFITVHNEKSIRATDNQVIEDFAALIQSSNEVERQLGEDLITYTMLLTPQASSTSLASKLPSGVLLGTDISVNLRLSYEMLQATGKVPAGFIDQLYQHMPKLAIKVDSAVFKDSWAQYEVTGRDYPEIIVFKYGQNANLQVVPGDGEQEYTKYISYRSKQEGRTILYRLREAGGTVTYQRVDTLGQDNHVEYDSKVHEINRSVFPENRAGYKFKEATFERQLDSEVEKRIREGSDPNNALSRWNLHIEGGEEIMNRGLELLSTDPLVPSYLRMLAQSLAESTVSAEELEGRQFLGVNTAQPFSYSPTSPIGSSGNFFLQTNTLNLKPTKDIKLAAETTVHENLHTRSVGFLRSMGWLNKDLWWSKYSKDNPNASKAESDKLFAEYQASAQAFIAKHPDLYRKAIELDKLRQQALAKLKAEMEIAQPGKFEEWSNLLKENKSSLPDDVNIRLMYSLSSMEEFVVQVLTQEDLMQFLNSIESTNKAENWIEKLLDAVTSFFAEVVKALEAKGVQYNSTSILKEAVALSYDLSSLQDHNERALERITTTLDDLFAPPAMLFFTEQEASHMKDIIGTTQSKDVSVEDKGTHLILTVGAEAKSIRTDYVDKVLENMYRTLQVMEGAIDRPARTDEDRQRQAEAKLQYHEVKDDYDQLKESNDLEKVIEIGNKQIQWVKNRLTKGNLHMSEVNVAWEVLDTWNSLSEIYKTGFDTTNEDFKLATSSIEGIARELTNRMVQQGMHTVIATGKEVTNIELTPADLGFNLKEIHILQDQLIYLERDANKLMQMYTTFTQYHVQTAEAEKRDLVSILKRFKELVPDEKAYAQFIQTNDANTVFGLVQELHPDWYQALASNRGYLRHRLSELQSMPTDTPDNVRRKRKLAERAFKKYWKESNKTGIAVPIDKILDLATGELRTDAEAQAVLADFYSKTVEESTKKVIEKAQKDYKKYLEIREIKFEELEAGVETDPAMAAFDPATLSAEDQINWANMTPDEQLVYMANHVKTRIENEKARQKISWESRNSPVSFLNTEPSTSQKEERVYAHNGRFKAWFAPKRLASNLDSKYEKIRANNNLSEAYDILTELSQKFRDYLPATLAESLHENFLPIVGIDQMAAASNFLSNFKTSAVGQKALEKLSVTKDQMDKVRGSKLKVKYAGAAPREETIDAAGNKVKGRVLTEEISHDLPRIFEMFGNMAIHYKNMYPVKEVGDVITRLVKEENNERLKDGKKGLTNLLSLMEYYQDMLVYQKPTEVQGVGTTPVYSANVRENKKLTRELAELVKRVPVLRSKILDEHANTGVNPYDNPNHPLVKELEMVENRVEEIRSKARYIAASKIADVTIGLQQLKSMSYNPLSAVSNFTYGYMAAMIHARGFRVGEDGFTKGNGDFAVEHLKLAFKMMKGNVSRSWLKAFGYEGGDVAKKCAAIIQRVGSIEALIDTAYGKTNLVEEKSNTAQFFHPFAAQKSGDFLTKGSCIIARTLNVPIKVLVDGEEKTIRLFDALNENGEWDAAKYGENKAWSSQDNRSEQTEWNKFTLRARMIQVIIFGAQDKFMPQHIKEDMFGRLLGQFKASWIPEGIKTRWGSDQGYSEVLERNVEGRYRTMLRMPGLGVPMLLQQAFSVMTGTNPLDSGQIWRTVDGERQLVDLQEHEKENMRRNLAGMAYTAFILASYYLLKAALPDDEEMKKRRRLGKDHTAIQRMTINMLYRTYQDLAIYSSPDVFDQLTGNPVPSWSVVRDALAVPKAWYKFSTDEGYHWDKAVLKTTKALPIVNNVNKLNQYATTDLSSAVR